MKEPRVKEVVLNYKQGDLKQVYEYLTHSDMVVDPSTWSGRVKSLIENKHFITAKQEIELTAYKFFNK